MLKLVSTIFYQSFVFPQSDSSSKTMKSVFYFIKKSPFCSHYIQTFAIFSLAFTLPRYKRTTGSGIICDVTNWLA